MKTMKLIAITLALAAIAGAVTDEFDGFTHFSSWDGTKGTTPATIQDGNPWPAAIAKDMCATAKDCNAILWCSGGACERFRTAEQMADYDTFLATNSSMVQSAICKLDTPGANTPNQAWISCECESFEVIDTYSLPPDMIHSACVGDKRCVGFRVKNDRSAGDLLGKTLTHSGYFALGKSSPQPPQPATSYGCDGKTGTCFDAKGTGAPFADKASCSAACKAPTLAPTPAPTPAGPAYIGCYVDCDNKSGCKSGNRDLNTFYCSNGRDAVNTGDCAYDPAVHGAPVHSNAGFAVMTPQFCSGLCHGFQFFGVAKDMCLCGNHYGHHGGKSPESDCNYSCPGDSGTMCGGGLRNSIYAQPPSMGGDARLYAELQANATATKRN